MAVPRAGEAELTGTGSICVAILRFSVARDAHPQAVARQITLEGHADAIGNDAYNLELSRWRADAVAQELVARGVRRDRLAVEGFGERRPIAPNTLPDGKDNPAGRALNRRVEAVVRAQDGSSR